MVELGGAAASGTERWRERLGWLATVNRPQSAAEVDALRTSVQRGLPFGEAAWVARTAATLRPHERPRKMAAGQRTDGVPGRAH